MSASKETTTTTTTTTTEVEDDSKLTVDERRKKMVQSRRAKDPLYYQDYLKVKELLTLQQPESAAAGCEAHDELLFIVIHQVYELWFKQILHEIDSVRDIFSSIPVDETKIAVAVRRLQRVNVIQGVLIQQLVVLETMSPIDFLDFRDFLYPASGFQSVQFRLVENRLGLPPESRLAYGARGYCSYLKDQDIGIVSESEKTASLYSLIEAWLERTPFMEQVGGWTWWQHYGEAVERMLASDEEGLLSNQSMSATEREAARKDLSNTRDHFASLFDRNRYEASRARGERRLSYRALQAALLITLYHDEPILALPYRLLEALLDIDESLTAWRHRHALMVHRMIGVKMGTGGSAGYHYLRAAADRHKIFTDLFNLSTFLIPRYLLPPLPDDVRAKLAFAFVPSVPSTPALRGLGIVPGDLGVRNDAAADARSVASAGSSSQNNMLTFSIPRGALGAGASSAEVLAAAAAALARSELVVPSAAADGSSVGAGGGGGGEGEVPSAPAHCPMGHG